KNDSARRVSEIVVQSEADDFLDAFVVAYRAFPSLLEHVRVDNAATAVFRRVERLANDIALARAFRMELIDVSKPTRLALLTPREQEVLLLLAEGRSNAEIADDLVISKSTAKAHVHNLLRKLGVSSRVQAALEAARIYGIETMRHS